jgi:hypothetical protein
MGRTLLKPGGNLRAQTILYTSGYPAAAFEHLGLKEQKSINFLSKPYKAVELQRMLTEILDD